jgi:signal transduction histidine kinase
MKLADSLSFRLALVYMALFCGPTAIIGVVEYWYSVRAPTIEVKERIRAEARQLVALHQQAGRPEVLAVDLAQRSEDGGSRLPYHAYIGADGRTIATNLQAWPATRDSEWVRVDTDVVQDGEQLDHEALLLDVRLHDGSRLLLGRDIEDIDEMEEKLLTAVVGVIGATLLLGLVGGALMSMAISRRIGNVTRAARQIMQGDLSGRVPASGSGDDFDRLNLTLNEMFTRIEHLFESVRRVSDNVAHELRTPLARLRASLETLHAAREPPSRDLIEDAIAEAQGLEKTFDAVLRISRIESGRHGATSAAVDLSAALQDAVELYGPEAEERGQTLRLETAGDLTLPGDRDLLFQSVCNLIDNAIKYTPRGGSVLVAARRSGAYVVLEVTDTGPGIAAEHRENVVERFYRVPSTAAAPGAGLGLSLVAAVAERHHSSLEFADAGPGLTVRWRLPAEPPISDAGIATPPRR